MKVWVDCTAAAHPLVLRPIIERLEARGDEVFVTAREYGQTRGHPRPARDAVHRRRRARRRLAAGQGAGAGRPLGAAGAARLGAAAASWRSPTARSTSPSSPRSSASPRRRCRTTSSPACSARSPSGVARRVLVPGLDPARAAGARSAPRSAKLVRYPGLKEEYYLADFEPDPAVLDELGLDREKVLVVVRPPPETSEYHARNDLYGGDDRPPRRRAARRRRWSSPAPSEQGEAARALGAANLIVPERAIDAQSLIAYADLVVSAGGTMNREAVALGTPVFTTFTRPHGRRRRGADRRRAACRCSPTRRRCALRKRDSPVGVRHPRDPEPAGRRRARGRRGPRVA